MSEIGAISGWFQNKFIPIGVSSMKSMGLEWSFYRHFYTWKSEKFDHSKPIDFTKESPIGINWFYDFNPKLLILLNNLGFHPISFVKFHKIEKYRYFRLKLGWIK